MTLQLELSHLIGLLLALLGGWFGFAKLFFAQVDRRLNERFQASDAGLAGIQAALVKHGEDEAERFRRVEEDLREQGGRLSKLEADTARAPTHDDLRGIHKRLDGLVADLGRIPGMERMLHDINDYLLKNK